MKKYFFVMIGLCIFSTSVFADGEYDGLRRYEEKVKSILNAPNPAPPPTPTPDYAKMFSAFDPPKKDPCPTHFERRLKDSVSWSYRGVYVSPFRPFRYWRPYRGR